MKILGILLRENNIVPKNFIMFNIFETGVFGYDYFQ